MRKTIIITAALAALVASPVMAGDRGGRGGHRTSAEAVAVQEARSVNDGVQLVNTFEAPDSDGSLKTVPDISAPVINAAPETCGIPVAGGAAWMGFGFTAGTAYTDQECVDRLNARQFVQMGQALGGAKTDAGRRVIIAGVELMCEGKKQKALARAGVICGEESADEPEKLVQTGTDSTYVSNDDGFSFQSSYGD